MPTAAERAKNAIQSHFGGPAMKAFLSAASSFCAIYALIISNGNAQTAQKPDGIENQKWICVLEQAAGVMYTNRDAKEPTARSVNFEDKHKKFLLTIKQIVRTQQEREMCRANIAYWMPKLLENGTFEPSDRPNFNSGGDIRKFIDFRANIGPHCFASNEASMKFFDRNEPSTLVSYDFLPTEFEGLPGQWLKLHGSRFEAGELLDLGPVVFTGTCERID
jgi:hypothetical protein